MEGLQVTNIIGDTSNIEWLKFAKNLYINIDSYYEVFLPEQPSHIMIGVFNSIGENSEGYCYITSPDSGTIYFTSSGYGKITVSLTTFGFTMSQKNPVFDSNSSVTYVAWKEK